MNQPGPEPDDLQLAYQAMGDMLAAIPYRLGYRLEGSDQLVIQTSSGNNRRLIVLDWPTHLPGEQAATRVSQTVAALAASTKADAILCLGYGPEAAARVYRTREHLASLPDLAASVAAVQVQDGQWRAFGVGVTGDWHPMPEAPVDLLVEGFPAPASSVQEFLRLHDPLPEPTYQILPPASRELIDPLGPELLAELGTRTLDRLAQRQARPLDQATLAYIAVDSAVNTILTAHAFPDRARTGALVDAYRGAPPEHRAPLAAAAATALWLRGQIHAAKQPLAQIHEVDTYADTARYLTSLIDHGVSPHEIAPSFPQAARLRLERAEAAWVREQAEPPPPGLDGPLLPPPGYQGLDDAGPTL